MGYDGPLLAPPRRAASHRDRGRHRGRPRRGRGLPLLAVGLTLGGMWLTVASLTAGLAVFTAGVLAAFGWAARDVTDRIEAERRAPAMTDRDTWTRRG
jgi:hypothetical protein